jgi:hypothetical protein
MQNFTETVRGYVGVSDYDASYKEAEELLKTLSKKLKQHKKKFSQNEKNWGYVGDLERLVSILREADEAI